MTARASLFDLDQQIDLFAALATFGRFSRAPYASSLVSISSVWVSIMFKLSFPLLLIAGLTLSQSGCVTTQGPASNWQPKLAQALNDLNPFDTVGTELRQLVEAKKFVEARGLFREHYGDYFKRRYVEEKRQIPKELAALGEWHYNTEFRGDVDDTISKLRVVNSALESQIWSSTNASINRAKVLIQQVGSEDLFFVSNVGFESIRPLHAEAARVTKLFKDNREMVFASTFDRIISAGHLPANYPIQPFVLTDYVASASFQNKVTATVNSAHSDTERNAIVTRLSSFMSGTTRKALVDEFEARRAKERLLADGRIDLEELDEVQRLAKQYGSNSGFDDIVKIGYVDLTATSFRDRNVFDFEIAFEKDFGIKLEDAKDALLAKETPTSYDYIFVTDLSAAKISREFKNKRSPTSKTQSGTRQEPNPDYVTATANYQQALAEMQKAKVQNAIQGSQPCYGNAFICALGAVARGATEGLSEAAVKQKANTLASTPQMVNIPVYSQYTYQLVDISASKVARVDYYVIDIKDKKVFSSYFEVKDHEKFNISYGIEENDPDRSSILRNSQKEDDVTAWEKKPVNIKLSELFHPKNLASAETNPFTTVETFLEPLSTRKYASAAPVYGKGKDPRTVVKGGDTESLVKSDETRASRTESGTIADERFDSVVIIKNANSVGSGFYVTPDLVLTAYHVVDKANLVEMTFYDGTKTFGKVIDHDVRLDLALIKAQTAGKPVKIYRGSIKLGETVEAIGHPKGYEFTITRGVVSALRRQRSAAIKANALVEFVQTDTPISPGNSGGPLFLKDAVIAVNDWVRVDKASQNLNFSVSYNEIRNYLDRFEGKPK